MLVYHASLARTRKISKQEYVLETYFRSVGVRSDMMFLINDVEVDEGVGEETR